MCIICYEGELMDKAKEKEFWNILRSIWKQSNFKKAYSFKKKKCINRNF